MHDGYFMYVELYPPHAIDGCTAMKARVGKTQDTVDLFLDIDSKRPIVWLMSVILTQ